MSSNSNLNSTHLPSLDSHQKLISIFQQQASSQFIPKQTKKQIQIKDQDKVLIIDLQESLGTQINQVFFTCVCGRKYKDQEKFRLHEILKGHLNEQPIQINSAIINDLGTTGKFICFCGKEYLSATSLALHRRTKHRKQEPIKIVPEKADHQEELIEFDIGLKHRIRHQNTGGTEFQCGCGKFYLTSTALYNHVQRNHKGIEPSGTKWPQNNIMHSKKRTKWRSRILSIYCQNCNQKIYGTYLKCLTCDYHLLCDQCYSNYDNDDMAEIHQWQVQIIKNQKK